jgi:hypothetical protein
MMGGGDQTIALLRIEEVQTELEIAPEQNEAIDKLSEESRQGGGMDFSKVRDMTEEERAEFFTKFREEQTKRNKEMKEKLEEVLLPPQMERLEQISIQVRGLQALEDEEVATKLSITEDQKAKMKTVRDELQSGMRERMQELMASGDRDAMREAFTKIREEMESKVLAVLNEEQKSKFEEMKGEPFTMPEGFGRGGFGGRPGGEAGGRGGRPGGEDGGGRGRGERSRPAAEESETTEKEADKSE